LVPVRGRKSFAKESKGFDSSLGGFWLRIHLWGNAWGLKGRGKLSIISIVL